MSKKGKIITVIVMIVAVLALTGLGSFFILNQKEEVEGGNVLDVAWYDINGTEFTISTVDELYEFAELSTYYNFKDQTIKLGADIVLNEGNAEDWGESAPSKKWTPIDGFGGVFDGQGHTISGLYAKGSGTAIALFSNTMGSAEIKNFSVKNAYFEGRGFGGVASISSNGGGTFKQIYSDAIITVKGSYSGYAAGIASKINLKAEFEECWFDGVITTTGRNAGGIVDCIKGGTTLISHCLFSGSLESTWDTNGTRIGGLCGDVMTEGSGLELVDSLSTGTVTSAHAAYAGSILGLSSAGTSLKSSDTYGSVNSYKSTIGNSGSNGTINSSPLEMPGENLIGVKAYQWTNLNFDKYWAAVEESTPILKHFAETELSLEGVAKAYDASWYSETASEGVISTVEQLYGFYILSGNTNFSGKTVKLGADIVFNTGNAKDWLTQAPANVWYQITGFAGTFDGQGHTISGLYMATDGRFVGFFKSTTPESTVKNFSIKNCMLINHCDGGSTAASTGSVAGAAHGTFENIYSDAIMDVTGSYIGGLFGQVYKKTTISNCWFDGSIYNGDGRYTGGIVGSVTAAEVTVQHCLNTGSIEVVFASGYVNSGGIVGATLASQGIVLNINDCLNVGTITSKNGGLGSIIGHIVTGLVNINDCYALKGSNAKDNKGVGHVQGGQKGGVVTLSEDMLTGYLAYDWTTLNFSDYWSVVLNGTPILKTWAKSSPSVAGRQKAFDISWYDSTKDEYVIKNVKQMYGFYIMSGTTNFKGKTVKLGANIAMNSGNASSWKDAAPANVWFPIESFAGTFDGQGHTLSGLYVNTGARYAGLFGTTTKDATVKNLKLTNSLIIATGNELASTGSIAGAAHGTFDTIYSNAIVTGTGAGIGGILGQIWVGTTIRNSWFDGEVSVSGRYSGGVVGASTGGTHVIEHCLNTGKVDVQQPKSGFVNSGGIIGACYNTAVQLTIKDCFNAGKITANYGGVGSIIGHVVKGTLIVGDTYAVAGSNKKDGKAIGNVQGTVNGSVVQLPETSLLGTGAYKSTYLDFNKYWAAIANETPQLKSFSSGALSVAGLTKIYDTSWYDASKSEYTISTMEQLYGLTLLSMNTNFAGKTVKLANDITVNTGDASTWETTAPENAWIPITSFAGTLDGQGHTISGIYVPSTDNAGLIAKTTKDAVIKNLSLENSLILSGTNGGSIVGQGGGTFYGIYSNATVKASANQNGGILGYASADTTMELVQFDGYVVTARNQVAGLIGLVQNADATLKNCHVSGKVETTTTSGHMNMGMAVGRVCGTSDVIIENCLLNGYMTHNHPGATSYDNRLFANRFVGKMEGKNAWLTILDTVVVDDADHWPTYYGHTQGASGCSIWKDRVLQGLTEEQLIGAKAWFNSKLDFYMNMDDTTEGKAWVAIEGEMPLLKIFAEGKAVVDLNEYVQSDTSWIDDTKGTKNDPYIIKDASDLAGLSELAAEGNKFEGKFFIVTSDIVYNTGAPATEAEWANYTAKNIWVPIVNFAGSFDGQGHTISGLYTETGSKVGLFGTTAATATVKNLAIKNSYFGATDKSGSIVGQGGGTFYGIYSSAILKNSANVCGGIVGEVIYKSTFEQVQFDGSTMATNQSGGIAALVNGDFAVTMTDCLVSGTVATSVVDSHQNAGMLVGRIVNKADVVAFRCLLNGYFKPANTTASDKYARVMVGKVETSGSTFDAQYVNIVNDTDRVATNHAGFIQLSGGAWKNASNNHTAKASVAQLTGAAAVTYTSGLGYCANAEDTSEVWVARNNAMPTLRIFANKEDIADISAYRYETNAWYTNTEHAGTQADPYELSTAGDILGMSSLVSSGVIDFTDKYMVLTQDIVWNANAPATEAEWANYTAQYSWTKIGNTDYPFKGSFDGRGHSISGIYMKGTGTDVGLFGYTAASSTIKNLKVVNSYFEGKENVGGVTGSGGGTYNNVYSNAIVKASSQYAGGIIGRTNANASFTRCHFAGEVTSSGNYAGGITSHVTSLEVNFVECMMTGKVTAVQRIGGFLGEANGSAKITLTDCYSGGTTKSTNAGHQQHGGFVGYAYNTSKVEAIRCVMAGHLEYPLERDYARPLVGKVQGEAQYGGSAGVYLIDDNSYYSTELALIGVISLSNGNTGWIGSGGAGHSRLSVEQMTGENAVTNMPLLKISTDANGTSTWVATKNGFPTLRFFANEADILTK